MISPVGLEQSGHPGGLIHDEDLREEPGLGGGVEHLCECTCWDQSQHACLVLPLRYVRGPLPIYITGPPGWNEEEQCHQSHVCLCDNY